jgi:hypothetical protein
MKKKLICLLLFGAACHLHALSQPYFVPNAKPVSQSVFSPTDPGKQQCNFFVWLPNKNRIWFDLVWANDLSLLPDIDSLIALTADLLEPMVDSFLADGLVRRVEVDATQNPALFRVISHTSKPVSYSKIDGEMVQVKMDQDTIRIKVIQNKGSASFINLLVNNVADIKSFPANAGSRSLDIIKKAVGRNYPLPIKNNPRHAYYAVFNLEADELVSPDGKNFHAIRSGSDYLEITLLKPSLLYARGTAFTAFSFGASVNYFKTRGAAGSRLGIGAFWEPQFAFRNDSSGKIQSTRNDFLTLRFEETPNKPNGNFEILSTFSVSYLIRRSGNYFEKNTFRLGLPGISSGKLYMEPELFFNDFLKNVSPGIRLSLKVL